MKKKRKIHKDKNGRDYIKKSYFAGGKMKFCWVYVIDGLPADEFYEKKASDIVHFLDGEYWKISYEKDFNNNSDELLKKPDLLDDKTEDLPF